MYIRKVNAAEQVPTDRIQTGEIFLMIGNLVVDKPAAQRLIMHSIPKSQIVPDPSAKLDPPTMPANIGQKRVVEEISSEGSTPEEGKVRPSKKSKVSKCKSAFVLK